MQFNEKGGLLLNEGGRLLQGRLEGAATVIKDGVVD